mmetsp:Transcript_29363/g.68655  ORF Transcript_29363/g.68655 Transcript_29363/m.68655 type:complete len:209 (+) Transcript_29363:2389-3015(+)
MPGESLWSEHVRRAREARGLKALPRHSGRQPEVGELCVARCGDEHVLELEVAVDEALEVHVRDGERHLRQVEAAPTLWKDVVLALLQLLQQRPRLCKFQEEVDVRGVLEGRIQRDDERVAQLEQRLALGVDALAVVGGLRALRDGFQRVQLSVRALADKKHRPEATLPERLEDIEVVDRQRLPGRAYSDPRVRLRISRRCGESTAHAL